MTTHYKSNSAEGVYGSHDDMVKLAEEWAKSTDPHKACLGRALKSVASEFITFLDQEKKTQTPPLTVAQSSIALTANILAIAMANTVGPHLALSRRMLIVRDFYKRFTENLEFQAVSQTEENAAARGDRPGTVQ